MQRTVRRELEGAVAGRIQVPGGAVAGGQRRIPLGIDVGRRARREEEVPVVAVRLEVAAERKLHLAEHVVQLGLPRPRREPLEERNAEDGEAADDGENEHHLDEGEALALEGARPEGSHGSIFCLECRVAASCEFAHIRLLTRREQIRRNESIWAESFLNPVNGGVQTRPAVALSVGQRKLRV